jgi:hypothetical protein
MVETTPPLPPGFPANQVDAATLPTEPPVEAPVAVVPPRHPMEQWAEPNPAFEQRVRRILPGGGHADMSPAALKRFEAEREWIRRVADTVKHPATAAAEQRQAEAEAEAKRKASDPRAVLRQAHVLQAEAQAEADRIGPLVARAGELVAEIEDRARRQEAAAKAARAAAAEALIEALVAGEAPPPEPGEAPPLVSPEAELRTAKTALARLESDLASANDRLARCKAGVSRCACNVLADQAADIANGVIADQARLDQRRRDLDALGQLLTAEGRRLNAQPLPLPPQISKALCPPDPVLTGADRGLALTDWGAAYRVLCEDPRNRER